VQDGQSWRARDGVVSAELDGDLTLFDGADTAFVLNHTAADVWELLQQPGDVSSVVDVLAERYGVPPAAIADDVTSLLRELAARGLVVPA
jgi:hypothetical protein